MKRYCKSTQSLGRVWEESESLEMLAEDITLSFRNLKLTLPQLWQLGDRKIESLTGKNDRR